MPKPPRLRTSDAGGVVFIEKEKKEVPAACPLKPSFPPPAAQPLFALYRRVKQDSGFFEGR